MPYPLISKVRSLALPVQAYGPGNVTAIITHKKYYSVGNTDEPFDSQPDFFIIHFNYTPIFVDSVKITIGSDVFPTSWSIALSNDNETFETIYTSTTPLCKTQYQIQYQQHSKNCSIGDTNTFQFDSSKQILAKYLKFQLHQNSYNETINQIFSKLIYFQYFEVFGIFYVQYFPRFSPLIYLRQSFLFIFILS